MTPPPIRATGAPMQVLLVEDSAGDVRQADESLRTIPTVILTTSESEADIVKSYQLQANCYLSKPVQLEAFDSLVKSINDFWLTKAKLPQQRNT